MKYTIYLIGQISMHPETYEWRKRVQEFFADKGKVSIISPTDSPFNANYINKALNGNAKEKKQMQSVYKTKGIKILPAKDMNYVYTSNFAIANLNHYTPEKPILGTYFELAWYLANPDKTVIAIYDGDPMSATHTAHPFVQAAVTAWVKDDKEACELADYYMDVR